MSHDHHQDHNHCDILDFIADALAILLTRSDENMGAQEDIDKATATITSATTTLDTAAAAIGDKLGAGVNTADLDAALGPLTAAVAGIQALANTATTATATSTTSTPATTSTTSTTSTVVPTATTTTTAAAPAARTVGTGLPGDPVRPA
jgi:hypothetical protein